MVMIHMVCHFLYVIFVSDVMAQLRLVPKYSSGMNEDEWTKVEFH